MDDRRDGEQARRRQRKGPWREPVLLTIPEAADALAIGRTTFYALIDAGRIEVVHIGRCVRVPVAALHEFVDAERSRA